MKKLLAMLLAAVPFLFMVLAYSFGVPMGRIHMIAGELAFLLLILAGTVKYIPFASRSALNSMMQLSGEIEEAAIIQDIPWWKRMCMIIIPIQKTSIISGFLLPFMTCLRELTLFTVSGKNLHDDAPDACAMLVDFISGGVKMVTVARRSSSVSIFSA